VGTYSYTYDDGGRLTQVSFPWGDTATSDYLANDWLKSVTTPLTRTTYSYDARGRLLTLNNQTSLLDTLSYFDGMSYDAAGNRLGASWHVPLVPRFGGPSVPGIDRKVSYTYDDKDRLVEERSLRNTTQTGFYAVDYDYHFTPDAADGLAGLRSGVEGGVNQSLNADNQVTTDWLERSFSYDGDGNQTGGYRLETPHALTFDADSNLLFFDGVFRSGWRPDGLRGWKGVGGPLSGRFYFLYDAHGQVIAICATPDNA
jgi:YD repeat-containing protein